MADEMLRVTRSGGIAFISYTVWYGPWGGHETRRGTTSAAPGPGAATCAKHGHEPKNKYGESLFPVTVRDGLAWARSQQARRGARPDPALQPAVELLADPGARRP